MKINIKLDDGACMPDRAHDTDAGADLKTPIEFTVPVGGSASIDTGVHIELPHGKAGLVKSKSGLFRYHGIFCDGLIDEGYSGSIVVTVYNLGSKPYRFKKGKEIGQLVIASVDYPTFEQVGSVEGGERGSAGFGSTGD